MQTVYEIHVLDCIAVQNLFMFEIILQPNEKCVKEFEDRIYEDIKKVRDSKLATVKNEA